MSRLLSGHGLGRRPFISNVYLKVAKHLLPDVTVFKENKIYLDSPDAMSIAIFGKYRDEYFLSLFESEIENTSSIVLDIGANIGLYTLAAAKHADKVYSFEPDPVSFANLKKNIDANKLENVVALNKAVSDKNGTARFTSHSEFPLDRGNLHLINHHEQVDHKYIFIDAVALDTFFNNKPKKIDIVKMDIEGSEFEALKGMNNLINENRNIKLFLELNPYVLTRHGTDLDAFIDYLFTICPRIYHIDEASKAKRLVSREWLLDFGEKWKFSRKEGHFINLLAIRNIR